MKTIIQYQCEICNSKYENEESAITCEKKGLPDEESVKIGTMFSRMHGGFIGVFCVANIRKGGWNKHALEFGSWACRAKPYHQNGDTLGDGQYCGNGNSFINDSFSKKFILLNEHVGCEEFLRMVNYLQSRGITPQYYNEQGELIIVSK